MRRLVTLEIQVRAKAYRWSRFSREHHLGTPMAEAEYCEACAWLGRVSDAGHHFWVITPRQFELLAFWNLSTLSAKYVVHDLQQLNMNWRVWTRKAKISAMGTIP